MTLNPPILKKTAHQAAMCRDFFLDMIFPANCLGCGVEGAWLCEKCRRNLNFKHEQSCLECGKKNVWGEICENCAKHYYLEGALAAGDYRDELLAGLIKCYKYKFVRELSEPLAAYINIFINNIIKQGLLLNQASAHQQIFQNCLIVPVPLHKKRLNWRGFNQSRLIVKLISGYLNFDFDDKSLLRLKTTRPQAKTKIELRQKNIEKNFLWQGANLNNKNIIIFDDVITSGATMNECAKALKTAGAGKIWGLALARG